MELRQGRHTATLQLDEDTRYTLTFTIARVGDNATIVVRDDAGSTASKTVADGAAVSATHTPGRRILLTEG